MFAIEQNAAYDIHYINFAKRFAYLLLRLDLHGARIGNEKSWTR